MSDTTPLLERSEILFLYQVRDCNPNGDPLEENQPRVDPETGVATITDVRIKRTIRDYWQQVLQREIWIRNGVTAEGLPETAEHRRAELEKGGKDGSAAEFRRAVLERCIDARTFGCILAVTQKGGKKNAKKAADAVEPADGPKGSEVAVTGPVQFSGFNRSLHRVSVQMVQGTAAFASRESAAQKSFRTDHLLPYALIGVYGVVNEVAARGTGMSAEDRELVLEGLWRGTEHLHSRSKMGHQPLALLELADAGGRRIGDLPSRLRLVSDSGVEEVALRSLEEFRLDATLLAEALRSAARASRLCRLRFRQDPRLRIEAGGQPFGDFLRGLQSDTLKVDVEAFQSW